MLAEKVNQWKKLGVNIPKLLFLTLLLNLCFAPSVMASGGSVYHNAIGFTVIGIDDGTWTDINICDSEDNAIDRSPAHCLILKKGAKSDGGGVNYSDAKDGCRLLGKYVEENFATGNTDDDYMLSQYIAIIKVPKGNRGCTLVFNGTGTSTRRSVTGLYRTSS